MFRVSVRRNSTSPFLSDLLKRVNAVTNRANEMVVDKSGGQTQALKAKKSKASTKTTKSGSAPAPEPTRLPKSDVQILNHPMRNRFGQNRDGEVRPDQRGQDGVRARGPRGPRAVRTNAAKSNEGATQKRNNAKRSTRGQGRSLKPRSDEVSVPVKELHAVPLAPQVSGNTFLYGKPVSLVISPSSRAAALAKEALVESKYPYRLPKEVIANIPARHPNRFILQQSSFSVLVNPEQIKNRYAHMVQGKPLVIDTSKAKGNDAQFVDQQILQNGDLSLNQRQLLFDVATGLKLAQEMFKNAAWNK